MSILQIEFSDEVRQLLEEYAHEEGRDAQSWVMTLVEETLRTRQREQEERRRELARHLLHRADEPTIVATPQWWDEVLTQGLADAKESEQSK